MPDEKEMVRLSKFLSLVLRHQPEKIDHQLDEHGWANVASLLQNAERNGIFLDRDTLQLIVDTNSKKRFAFNEEGTKIRASQGHSVVVDLGYAESAPPEILYHGTAQEKLDAVLQQGLQKMKRQHVHLSSDKETATLVGRRHGKPVLLQVAAGNMYAAGYTFFLSANGVWLTETVPARYLQLLPKNTTHQ